MSLYQEYITDTTLWEDYFINNNSNVQDWVKEILGKSEGRFLVSPVVLLEFIRRLYYYHNYSPKKIGLAMKLMTNIFRDISFPAIHKQTIKEIAFHLGKLPREPRLDIGEISFLNLLNRPEIIVVSSDNDVLDVYTFVNRIDPREKPAKFLPAE